MTHQLTHHDPLAPAPVAETLRYLGGLRNALSRRWWVGLIALHCVLLACTILEANVLGYSVDVLRGVAVPIVGTGERALMILVGVACAATFVGHCLRSLANYLIGIKLRRMSVDLKRDCLNSTLQAPIPDVMALGTGNVITRMTHDIDQPVTQFSQIGSRVMFMLLMFPFSIGAMTLIDYRFGVLALVIAGCAAGGYYYYDHYLAAPAPAEEKTMARPDTTPAKPAPVADNEAEMREKVITYWDVYAKRSSGLIIQYSNAQLRKMLEAKGFALKTDHSADNASAEGEAQPEQSQVYELTTNKGEVLCRFVLNNDRVYNELWFKYPEDKAAFVKGAAASGFKAGTSADRETKVPTYYSSFASDSVRTYPNTRHDYIVAGNETLKLCRERER